MISTEQKEELYQLILKIDQAIDEGFLEEAADLSQELRKFVENKL